MLGDFTVKKHKIEKENSYLTKNRLTKNKMWCVSHMFKGFLDSNFIEAVIEKISNFHKIAPNFTYSQQ